MREPPKEIPPQRKLFPRSALEGSALTQKELDTLALFYETYLDKELQKFALSRIRSGTNFSHEGATYTLPRTFEVSTHSVTGKKTLFLALNKMGQFTQKTPERTDKLLGHGATKKVKIGVHLEEGILCARAAGIAEKMAKEVRFIEEHGHQIGLLSTYGSLTFYSKHGPQKCAYYTPLAPYGNFRAARRSGFFDRLKTDQKLLILETAFAGLQFLHQNNLIHGDLKEDNLLVIKERGDFVAKIIDLEGVHSPGILNLKEGVTRQYLPPELLKPSVASKSEFSRDLWCMGLACYPLFLEQGYAREKYVSLFLPSERSNLVSELSNRKESSLIMKDEVPTKQGKMDENSIEYLFWSLLQFDPAKRPSASDARAKVHLMRTKEALPLEHKD